MHTAPPPLPIVRGEGVYLYTEDGRRLLDGISSWWVNIHGHAHPRLNAAIAAQANCLEHVVFAGCTHPAAVELAERLVGHPSGRTRPRLLLRQRFDGGRGGAEAGLPVLDQHGPARAAPVHHLASRLPRRHRRRDVRERRVAFHQALRATAIPGAPRARAVLLPLSARSRPRDVPRSIVSATWSICSSSMGHEIAGVLVEPMLQGGGRHDRLAAGVSGGGPRAV